MAVIRLKVLLLLMWVAIPGLHCQDLIDESSTTTEVKYDLVTATEDPFRESTTVDELLSTKSDERGTSEQETTPIPDTYLNVDGGGCLQQSKTPANLETACRFCEDNGGRLVDLDLFVGHNLGTILTSKNITMWIQFDCTNSSARCTTFYPYENVTCSKEYNYFCYHNETGDEKCRDVQDTTPTVTSTTALTSTNSNSKPGVTSVAVKLTFDGNVTYLAVGIIVFMVVVVVIAGFFIYRRHRNSDERRGKEDRRERDEPEVVESDLPEVEQTLSCSQMKLQFIDEDTYDHLGVQKRKEDKDDSSKVYGHLIQEPNDGDYDTTNFKGPSTEVVDKLYARSNFETSDT